MAGLRFTDLQSRPTEFLDFTSVTLDEFQQLVPPFEAAFQSRMAVWRMDGKPRTARQFTVYQNCPLPTPEDRLLFILAYENLPTSSRAPVRHGAGKPISGSHPLTRAAGACGPSTMPPPLPDGPGTASRL
jgi:hypothetical protein